MERMDLRFYQTKQRELRMTRGKVWGAAIMVAVLMQMSVASDTPEKVLKASEISAKVLPDKVFFRGQVASVQARNSGGVHFGDDAYVLAALVDSSGYSTDIRQKYQGYLMTEAPLEVGGQKLPAGAYGFGFVGGKFVVMDLGAHDVLSVASAKDADLKHPVPLQMVATSPGKYRLYAGREYVDLNRAQ
jgi:hypothetical protein